MKTISVLQNHYSFKVSLKALVLSEFQHLHNIHNDNVFLETPPSIPGCPKKMRKWEIWIVMFSVTAVFRKGMKQHQKTDPTLVSASEKVVSCFWAWKCPSLSFSKTKNVPVAWFCFRGFYSTFFKACVTKMDCVLTVLSANN